MIQATGAAVAGLALQAQFQPLLAAPADRRFKIGACDWSIGKSDASGFELAKKLGLDGLEVEMGSAKDRLPLRRPEVQKAYQEAAKRYGVEIASVAMGVLNNVPLKSEPVSSLWLLDGIEACRNLGANVILMACFARGELKGDQPGIDRVTEVFKEMAPRAEKAGVILGFENYLSAPENLAVLEKVNSPALKVYYDVGNSTDKGYDIYQEIRLLGKNICQFHFKDGGFLLGKGRIDFKKVREALDAIEYRGWLHLEAAAPNGVLVDYPANREFLRGIFDR
jgi:sugar phosphate isomerase/epimerase